jgi:hypothetical protein
VSATAAASVLKSLLPSMLISRLVPAVAFGAFLLTAPASASIVTYTFSGTLDTPDSANLTASFAPTISGSWTIDSNAIKQGDNTVASYLYSSFQFQTGSYTYVENPASGDYMEVDNDNGGGDSLFVTGGTASVGGTVDGKDVLFVELGLSGPTTLWSSTAIPTVLPDITAFNVQNFFAIETATGLDETFAVYTLTDLNVTTPEPSSAVLGGLGTLLLAAAVAWKRHNGSAVS